MTIIVTGSQRGGTTAVAGAVRCLGIEFPNSDNSHENVDLFSALIDEDWQKLQSLIASYSNEHDQWGWKYPSITRFPKKAEVGLAMFPNLKIIHVWRDVYSVATHRLKHMPDSTVEAQLKRLHAELGNQLETIDLCKDKHSILHVSYEKLITYPNEQIERIQKYIGTKNTNIAKAVNYIKPGKYQSWPP